MSIITIVGAGMMGSAMSVPATDQHHEVRIVGTPLDRDIISHAQQTGYHLSMHRQLPRGNKYYQIERLRQALDGADLLISGVSSMGVDWLMEHVLPLVPVSLPVLSVTKGMINTQDGHLLSFPELYTQRFEGQGLSFNAIGGPCISYELVARNPTQVCFCGSDMNVLRKLKHMLSTDYYHVSLSTDVRGVECAVALKNAYALGVALSIGNSELQDGKMQYNSQAALFGQSMKEIQKILALDDGDDTTMYLAAGDLYVTVFGGRTRQLGTLLGKGYSFEDAEKQLEGVTLESVVIAKRTAKAIRKRIQRGQADIRDFPLLMHIDDLLAGKNHLEIPWSAFVVEMDA